MSSNIINYDKKGILFNIQRFSIHDGPGVRTIAFLKGCPLSCRWCSNPESQNPKPQIMYNEANCIGCGNCIETCPRGAISMNNHGLIDREKCIACGKCADVCYAEALVISGEERSVFDVVNELGRDSIQFRRSGGGITLSGGEPLIQPDFSREILKACKSKGWHTAMETTGAANEEIIRDVIPWVDLVLLDIKNINDAKHIKYVGASNSKLLENARLISELDVDLIIRVPVIPGFNADIESIDKIAKFARSLKNVNEMHLLPYHEYGTNKYKCIGREYTMPEKIKTPSKKLMEQLKSVVESNKLRCSIGGQ